MKDKSGRRMDPKIIAYVIIALLVGSTVGYFGDNIINEPIITPLQKTVDNLTAKVANLTASLDTLKAQNTLLQESVQSLRSQNLANKTVKIGYIAIKTTTYNSEDVFIKEIIEPDLNEYASKLGYDLHFEFVVELVKDDWALNRGFIELKSKGVNLVIVGNGGLGVGVTLSYAWSNKMLIVSATSNQTDFAQPERPTAPLFRLCPVRGYTGTSLADLMWGYGIRTAVILWQGSSWGDETEIDFQARWESLGGVIADAPVRYDPATTDFSGYLQQLDNQVETALLQNIGTEEKVGVLALCRDEAPIVARQAKNYTNLFKATWFGGKYTANNTQLAALAGPQVERIKWISLKSEDPKSDSYDSPSSRYKALTGQRIDIYSAYLYDAAFLLARSVVEAQSNEGPKVEGVFGEVCNSTFGVTGWCGVDLNRDRIPPPYEIWSYARAALNTTVAQMVGTLDPVKHEALFYESLG